MFPRYFTQLQISNRGKAATFLRRNFFQQVQKRVDKILDESTLSDSLSEHVLTNFIETTLQPMHGKSLMTLLESVPI